MSGRPSTWTMRRSWWMRESRTDGDSQFRKGRVMDLLDELIEEAAAQEGAVELDSAYTADLLRRAANEIGRLQKEEAHE